MNDCHLIFLIDELMGTINMDQENERVNIKFDRQLDVDLVLTFYILYKTIVL